MEATTEVSAPTQPTVIAAALAWPVGGSNNRGGLLWESSYAGAASTGAVEAEPTHTGCYLAGTQILTPSGEGLVQALRIGDSVVTQTGMRRQVKWIGRRSYAAATMAAHRHLRPVILRAGCLGVSPQGGLLPSRDLYVAPMHAIMIEDAGAGSVLVPAVSLINGVSIQRAPAGEAVSYVHLELNSHDIVLAEGVPAETFIDCGNRAMFQNAAEFAALYPRNLASDWRSCMQRLEEGHALDRIRARIAARAGVVFAPPMVSEVRFELERRRAVLEGWAVDMAAPDVAVELDILLDGQRYARLPANRYRPDLDHAGLAGGRCGFTCPLPARGGHIAIRHVLPAGTASAVAA